MGNTQRPVARKAKPTSKTPVKPIKKPPAKPIKKPVKKPAANKKLEKARKKDLSAIEAVDDIINNGIDFCNVELTPRRRDFLIYYITPGQPLFHNALQAALKAGYSEATAKTKVYALLSEPDIQKIIKKNESLFYRKIHGSAVRAIEIKQHRAFYDPIDFFEKKEQVRSTKEGEEYTVEVFSLRDLRDMTPEQRVCIDGMDVKGQASIPVYLMPDRGKELNDIIAIDKELSRTIADTGEEETREIIMERVTIRETKRAQRPADIEYEFVERPDITDDGEDE